jgi:hypothetical protein
MGFRFICDANKNRNGFLTVLAGKDVAAGTRNQGFYATVFPLQTLAMCGMHLAKG